MKDIYENLNYDFSFFLITIYTVVVVYWKICENLLKMHKTLPTAVRKLEMSVLVWSFGKCLPQVSIGWSIGLLATELLYESTRLNRKVTQIVVRSQIS